MTDFETQLIAVLQEISNHLETTNDNLDTIATNIHVIDMPEPTDMSEVSHYIYQVSESIDRVQESIAEH